MKFLFAVHDWGLGHATRDLLLIRALLDEGHDVTVLTTGRALILLRQELGERCEFIEYPDIPKPLGRTAFGFYVRMTLSMPAVFRRFRLEREHTRRLCQERGFDRVVSDSRMGVVSTEVPSYYIFHSLRQIMPRPLRLFGPAVERNQRELMAQARQILVPDEENGGIAGRLCHETDCDWSGRATYIGILSSIEKQDVQEDIDVFISISGAEPQRSYFEQKILAQVAGLAPRKVVVTLGRPDMPYRQWKFGGATIHTYLDRTKQQNMLNRAQLVVTRSGYTTLMELAELGKRSLLVPTVGQSEQEYLADYHHAKGYAHAVRQPQLDLLRDVPLAEKTSGQPKVRPTRETIHRFLDIVTN